MVIILRVYIFQEIFKYDVTTSLSSVDMRTLPTTHRFFSHTDHWIIRTLYYNRCYCDSLFDIFALMQMEEWVSNQKKRELYLGQTHMKTIKANMAQM
jgi:hypothetical protein